MKFLAAVVATTALVVSACTGGGEDGKRKVAPSLPLPAKAPSADGPATGPPMQPRVLLRSVDESDEAAGSLDIAQVQRRYGAFITGRTVVGYSFAEISGHDLGSGDQLWTAKLDLGSGGVCFVSEPDRAVTTFTVVYGEGSYCPTVATIRISDGKVLKTSDLVNELLRDEGGSAGGSVTHVFTVGGQDYLVDMHGVVWKMTKGDPKPVSRLQASSYADLHPTPKGDVLIGARRSESGRCRVDGYALSSFKHLWTHESKTLFPDVREGCGLSVTPGSSAWLEKEAPDTYYMAQVDPRTGKVLGRVDAPRDSAGRAVEGGFDLASASDQLDRAVGLPGGDTIFAQVNGLMRYSLASGKVAWDLDLDQAQLDSDPEPAPVTVLPQGVTPDGYLVASVSNDTSVEVIAVDVRTGKLVARWPVPPRGRNGFQATPRMTPFGGGVVMTRNFDAWERVFDGGRGVEEPPGERYDVGVFTFPELSR